MAGALQLRRFQTTVFKSASASDNKQIPADGATVTVFKQGATVKTGPVTVSSGNVAVAVYGVGRLLAGDTVQKGTDVTKQMIVVSVDNDTQVTLTRAISDDITLNVDDRLVPYSNKPTLYTESSGTDTTPNPLTLGAQGLIEFYCPETRFDYIVTGGGIMSTLYIDNEGGWMRGGTSWVNVKDYSTFQAAINSLSALGGTIFIPPGQYNSGSVPALGAMTIPNRTTLMGDGVGTTWLLFDQLNTDLITVTGTNIGDFRMSGLLLQGAGSAGDGRGLVLGPSSYAHVERCFFDGFPSYAIAVEGGAQDSINNKFDNCFIRAGFSDGLVYLNSGAYHTRFVDCQFILTAFGGGGAGRGVVIDGAHATEFRGCTWDGARDTAGDGSVDAYIYITGSVPDMTLVDGCWFECTAAVNPVPNNWFIYINATLAENTSIRNTNFVRTNGSISSLRAIRTLGGCFDMTVENLHGTINTAGASTGTDDIKTAANNVLTIIGECRVWTGLAATDFTIDSADPALLTRVGNNKRFKVRALTTDERDALTDVKVGDIIYNSTTGTFQGYATAGGTTWHNFH